VIALLSCRWCYHCRKLHLLCDFNGLARGCRAGNKKVQLARRDVAKDKRRPPTVTPTGHARRRKVSNRSHVNVSCPTKRGAVDNSNDSDGSGNDDSNRGG
jgi:hypothetical protein